MKKLILFTLLVLALSTTSCNDGWTIENEHPEGYGWWSWNEQPAPIDKKVN